MRILVLIAGTNQPSNCDVLAHSFIDGIMEFSPTALIKTVRLDSLKIEHFTLSHYDASTDQGKDFEMIQKEVTESDGVVIASPIWNFGVPAHLKNLIDRMGSFALDETHSVGTLKGKPFYFIYTGGMPATGWPLVKRTTSFMDIGLQYFGATIIGRHYEGRCTAGKGIFQEVVSGRPESLKAVEEKGKKFGEVVDVYANEGSLPVANRMGATFFQFGGKMKKWLGL